MKLGNHKRKEWGGLATAEILVQIDRVYSDPAIVSQRFFDAGPVKRIHISKRADLLVIRAGGRSVCVKYFHDGRLWVKIRTLIGLAKGRRGYVAGLRVARAGVRVPEQLACVECRPFGPTVVVMEMLENVCTAAGWFFNHRSAKGPVVIPRALIDQFATFTANLHRQGIFHCDFSPRNVMVQEKGDASQFVLIDLEDVRFHRLGNRRSCVQNLARFARETVPHVSVYTVMRFLSAYIRSMGWNDRPSNLARKIMRAPR